MPVNFTKLGTEIWRDFNTADTPASGKYSPRKAEIRQWAAEIEAFLKTGTVSGLMPSLEVKSATPFVRFTDTDATTDATCEARIEGDPNGSLLLRADRQNAYANSKIVFEVDAATRGEVTPTGLNAMAIGQTVPALGTFTAMVGTSGRITSSESSVLDLEATLSADTHQRTRLVRQTNYFRIQTTDANGENVVNDLVAQVGASGLYSWTFNTDGLPSFVVTESAAEVFGVQPVLKFVKRNSGNTQVWFLSDDTVFEMQTRNAINQEIHKDYVATRGASGVTRHSWRIAGIAGEAFALDSAGIVFAGSVWSKTDGAHSIGFSTNRYQAIYATTGAIITSDEREKTDIEFITEAEMNLAYRIKAMFRTYRWKPELQRDSKKHFGLIAQELIQAFEAEGLNWREYGVINGGGDEPFGVNYSELYALLMSI